MTEQSTSTPERQRLIRVRARTLAGISVLWVPLAFLFDGVTVLVLPIRLGGDATTVGLVSFLGLGLAAALQPVAGWLGDRMRLRVARPVFAAAAAIPALGGLWLLVGSAGLLAAVVGYLVLQAAASAVQAAQQTLIPEHVDEPGRGRASGLKAASDVGGAFVAFLLLGVVLASGDLIAAGALTSAVLIAGVVVMVVLVPARRQPSASAAAPRRPTPGLPAGLGRLIAARFLFLFGTYAVGRFLLLLVGERLGIPPERAADEAGGLLALFTLATAAAALPFGWFADRHARRDVMAAGAVVAAVGILLLVPAMGLVGLLAGGLLMSVGTAAFVTANWAATTALVPASEAGRLLGLANLGTALAAACAGLVGPLIDTVGFGPVLLLATVASAAAVLPLLPAVGSPRSLENAT